jgi:hypothetical protein
VARLRKPKKKRSELARIRHEKVQVVRLIHLAEASGLCSKEKKDKFLARWQDLCSEEARVMADQSDDPGPDAAA